MNRKDVIENLKNRLNDLHNGYQTYLEHGGKGDPAEEAHIDALEMAIALLELQKQTFPHYGKENDNDHVGGKSAAHP